MTILNRLRSAESGSRELDWRIAEYLGDIEAYPEEADPPFRIGSPFEKAIPAFSTSIDAALALVERIVAVNGRKVICFFCAGGQLTPENADKTSVDYHPLAKIDNSVTVGWMAHVAFYLPEGKCKGPETYSHGKTAPLAILTALFSALEVGNEPR